VSTPTTGHSAHLKGAFLADQICQYARGKFAAMREQAHYIRCQAESHPGHSEHARNAVRIDSMCDLGAGITTTCSELLHLCGDSMAARAVTDDWRRTATQLIADASETRLHAVRWRNSSSGSL